MSLISTIVPVVAGGTLAVTGLVMPQSGTFDVGFPIIGAVIAGVGVSFGPSMGYFYVSGVNPWFLQGTRDTVSASMKIC